MCNLNTHIHKYTQSYTFIYIFKVSVMNLNVLKNILSFKVRPVYEDTTMKLHKYSLLPLKLSTSMATVLGVKLTKVLLPNRNKHRHVLYV